jgi:O-antigen ligase
MSVIELLRVKVEFQDKKLKFFFACIFLATLTAYLNYIFPFLPGTVFGFNWTGIAWLLSLFSIFMLIGRMDKPTFPFLLWLPWILYMLVSLFLQFSIIGLQLTLQYIIPILIGVIASSFSYSWPKLVWIFSKFSRLIVFLYILFLVYLGTTGFAPHMASTPMLFYVMASLSLGLFFILKEKTFLIVFIILFFMPFISLTRMAILVFLVSLVLHFSNKKVANKFYAGIAGIILVLAVFSSKGFQEKTFYDGSGEITDLSVNYYESNQLNSNGRKAWQNALEPGLASHPFFGNGPRADNEVLRLVVGEGSAEAHNDYLSVRYNYGFVGLACLLFGILASFYQLLKYYFKESDQIYQVLLGSTMTLFLGYLLFMYSDNILKYTIFFPNYFYAMMGIVFSLGKKGWSYH